MVFQHATLKHLPISGCSPLRCRLFGDVMDKMTVMYSQLHPMVYTVAALSVKLSLTAKYAIIASIMTLMRLFS